MQNKQWLLLAGYFLIVLQCIVEGRVSGAGRLVQEYIKNPSLYYYNVYYLFGRLVTIVPPASVVLQRLQY